MASNHHCQSQSLVSYQLDDKGINGVTRRIELLHLGHIRQSRHGYATLIGTENRSRTCMSFLTDGPKPPASTNSAISALSGTGGGGRTHELQILSLLPIPVRLHPFYLVGTVGFEPTTTQFQTEYATRLRYTPNSIHKKAPINVEALVTMKFYLSVIHAKAPNRVGS